MAQGLLVHRYTEEFARHEQVTGQVLLTLDDVTRRSHYRNAQRTFEKLLELGVVPIVNENDTVATSEIRFATTTGSPPHRSPRARRPARASLRRRGAVRRPATPVAAASRGHRRNRARGRARRARRLGRCRTGGMHTKLEAARIATGAGIPVVLTDMVHARRRSPGITAAPSSTRPAGVVRAGCCGSHTRPRPRAGSCSMTAPYAPHGATGLAASRRHHGGGGSFVAGDPVDLVDERGLVVARGLVNYDAKELPGCSVARPVSWPVSWERRTSARSCIATT